MQRMSLVFCSAMSFVTKSAVVPHVNCFVFSVITAAQQHRKTAILFLPYGLEYQALS